VSFWDFFTQQLPRVRELDQDPVSAAMFIHFVAFSPYRVTGTIPPSGWGEAQEFLDIKAAMAAGAWGVKFYPPAGYRASGNDIPSRPILYALLRKQWDSRYLDQSDARLDDINFALFKYCAENNIPVLAHCMTGEFQAASNYGELMAHPAFYRAVLDKLESLPTPLHLRLCLAHAGGPTFWYGIANDDAHKVWGEQVYELCTRYPNVYCDVGCLDNIMDKDQRLVFANQMLALFEKPTAPRAYPFASKIIYGSDWFMPEPAANGVDYLNEYRRVFLTPQLKSHYKDFLCRNALQFLGLAGGDNPRLATLSPAQRDHIRSLVQRARADDVGQ
jgi:predicted TIM-barrel fold metal-dependent hydrolase